MSKISDGESYRRTTSVIQVQGLTICRGLLHGYRASFNGMGMRGLDENQALSTSLKSQILAFDDVLNVCLICRAPYHPLTLLSLYDSLLKDEIFFDIFLLPGSCDDGVRNAVQPGPQFGQALPSIHP